MKTLLKYFMLASLLMGSFAVSGCNAQHDKDDKAPVEISPFPLA